MSDEWLIKNKLKRLKDDVGEVEAEKIANLLKKNSNEVRKDLFHVDEGGKETIDYLDKNANKIKPKG
ncbi:hypothetical protein IO457_001754 [Campylobacter coli]|nr:hypothetical protein [Campylobacter jejuni]EGK8183287.1 hypothetical protein [Campylobacter coli]